MLGLSFAEAGRTQNAPAASAVPHSGARAEFLQEISYYEERYTRLAETVPADKYNWRPADGAHGRTPGSIDRLWAHERNRSSLDRGGRAAKVGG
jgi:hypothetical protein